MHGRTAAELRDRLLFLIKHQGCLSSLRCTIGQRLLRLWYPLRSGIFRRSTHLCPMKVFVSSLITGMQPIRSAARSAITTFGHEPIMAEDFGALPHSPQIACLDGVRQAGIVILILGARYGAIQSSGLSATHEEYREARDCCPVLAFVEDGVTPEPEQEAFIREVQAWDSGLIRVGFPDAVQLERKAIQALHQFSVSSAATPFDAKEVLARALALFQKTGLPQRHALLGSCRRPGPGGPAPEPH